jgi:preprotein translocase subunit YajC
MFVSSAFAQGTGGGVGTGGWEALLPLVLIFVVFYFLLIRPQQKKMKQHKEMLSAVRRGDRVVTGGGILGTVTKVVDDNEIIVEIADGVRVRVQRSTIAAIVSKTEPAGGDAGKPAEGQSTTQTPASSGGGSLLDKLLGRK